MNQFALSYIIPAFNEEQHLPKLLESIKRYSPEPYTFEIIVADHSSQDNTARIAREHNAHVVTAKAGTVAGLRNLAAARAKGGIFIFLDADIVLTDTWCLHFAATYELLAHQPITITGSLCGIPDNANFIEHFWFAPMQNKKVRYINSGHLITTRELFERINGFDAKLQTGEDYDFSIRAHAMGAKIINNPMLRVIHYGYPSTLTAFVRREIWHGKGDCQNWTTLLHSKVAMASMLFVVLHLVSIGSLLLSENSTIYMTSLTSIFLLCFISAVIKHRQKSIVGIAVATFLYYCYFSARTISCILTFLKPTPVKQRRS